jgi:hypothetical protein
MQLYSKLSQADTIEAVDAASYLDELCHDLIASVHREGATSIVLPTVHAYPLGAAELLPHFFGSLDHEWETRAAGDGATAAISASELSAACLDGAPVLIEGGSSVLWAITCQSHACCAQIIGDRSRIDRVSRDRRGSTEPGTLF